MPNLPNWIYEPLPYVYVGTGIVTTYGLDSLLGKTSGIMLILGGIIIGYMRTKYRHLLRIRLEREAWLKDQAEKRKREKQAWLRDQAQRYRDELARKEEDF
jgi:hypothetical protein